MIDITTIEALEARKRETLKEMLTKVYETMERKLKKAVEMRQKSVFLRVPAFVLGYPAFDRASAQRYLARQFERGGFTVERIGDCDIFVSWAKTRETRRREKKRESQESASVNIDDFEFPSLVNLKKAANQWK
jgi:hypothetical protein|tara:strand:- start:72 stop:470 length:399 start_codon:yes stop_codon:yes gene_type:complete